MKCYKSHLKILWFLFRKVRWKVTIKSWNDLQTNTHAIINEFFALYKKNTIQKGYIQEKKFK